MLRKDVQNSPVRAFRWKTARSRGELGTVRELVSRNLDGFRPRVIWRSMAQHHCQGFGCPETRPGITRLISIVRTAQIALPGKDRSSPTMFHCDDPALGTAAASFLANVRT